MYKDITRCRCCDSDQLVKFIDLDEQPLANDYRTEPTELPTFPLAVNVCKKCWHTQLSVVVDPDILFKHYLYVSGTSQTLKDYSSWFAKWTISKVPPNQLAKTNGVLRVLDIACNDGSQLDHYKALGHTTMGVDPAANITPTAEAKGHHIITDYWSETLAEGLVDVDIIVAQNVFAHTHDILGFLKACQLVMHEHSLLFIQTSQANMYLNGEFDTIYHEHLSFFNTNSMETICRRAGLNLQRVDKTDIHGTSYVFTITRTRMADSIIPYNVFEAKMKESEQGLYSLDTYLKFGENAKRILSELRVAVTISKLMGKTVVGLGAAAKGMTVLNAAKLDLDYILDDASLKQGRFTPGRNIPIKTFNDLPGYGLDNIVFVPLAWNFYKEMYKKVKINRSTSDDKFLQYFPYLKVTE